MFNYLIFLLFLSGDLVHGAPHKSKNKKYDKPQLIYDQTQTGDYNIQVHLKDFQIIAMFGDDALGDYDYNYDYSDFTIKPSSTSTTTTPKSTSSSPPSSTTQKELPSTSQSPLSTTSELIITSSSVSDNESFISSEKISSSEKPPSILVSNAHPYPIEVIVPQTTNKSEDEQNVKRKEVEEVHTVDIPTDHAQVDKNSQELTLGATLNLISNSKPLSISQTSTSPPKSSNSMPEHSSPSTESLSGKIKVQILGTTPSTSIGSSSVGIVPGEDVQGDTNGSVLQSEVANYRKCSSGYARDKRGRCRRVRRPSLSSQLPFGFSRLASNLATRLRLKPHDNPSVTSMSTEK